jgi:hypothetical protein
MIVRGKEGRRSYILARPRDDENPEGKDVN